MASETLKITIQVSGVCLPAMPMHFDDILAAAAVNQYLENHQEEISDYGSIINNLPMVKHAADNEWVWKASTIRWKHKAVFMKPITSRIDALDITMKRNEGILKYKAKDVNTLSGPLKSSISLLPSAGYSEGVAYCIGDKQAIEELLKYITYIGKKNRRGNGKVVGIKITVDANAENRWSDRFLPLEMQNIATSKHHLAHNIGIKPPYWKEQVAIGMGIET